MSHQTDPEFLVQQEYDEATALKLRNQIQLRYRSQRESWFQWVFARLHLPPECRILELGCGSADLWQENHDHIPPGWWVTLTDLSPGMLGAARENRPHSHDFRLAQVNAQALPFPEEIFHGVLAIGLLDHLPDRRTAFNEIRRVLKPGGKFYAATGGRLHLQEIEALLRPFLSEADLGGDPHRFGLENGAQLLSPWFCQVHLERYEDELVFRSPDPIIAYALSEAQVSRLLQDKRRKAFVEYVRQELARRGELRVRNNKGLFEATKED